MVEDKMDKAIKSIDKARESYRGGNYLLAKGDLDYAKEYILETYYLIVAEFENFDGIDDNLLSFFKDVED